MNYYGKNLLNYIFLLTLYVQKQNPRTKTHTHTQHILTHAMYEQTTTVSRAMDLYSF